MQCPPSSCDRFPGDINSVWWCRGKFRCMGKASIFDPLQSLLFCFFPQLFTICLRNHCSDINFSVHSRNLHFDFYIWFTISIVALGLGISFDTLDTQLDIVNNIYVLVKLPFSTVSHPILLSFCNVKDTMDSSFLLLWFQASSELVRKMQKGKLSMSSNLDVLPMEQETTAPPSTVRTVRVALSWSGRALRGLTYLSLFLTVTRTTCAAVEYN